LFLIVWLVWLIASKRLTMKKLRKWKQMGGMMLQMMK